MPQTFSYTPCVTDIFCDYRFKVAKVTFKVNKDRLNDNWIPDTEPTTDGQQQAVARQHNCSDDDSVQEAELTLADVQEDLAKLVAKPVTS